MAAGHLLARYRFPPSTLGFQSPLAAAAAPGVLGDDGVMYTRRASAGGPHPRFLDGSPPRRTRRPPSGAAPTLRRMAGTRAAQGRGARVPPLWRCLVAVPWSSILFSSELTAAKACVAMSLSGAAKAKLRTLLELAWHGRGAAVYLQCISTQEQHKEDHVTPTVRHCNVQRQSDDFFWRVGLSTS